MIRMFIGFIKNLKIPIASVTAIVNSIDVDKDGCISVAELIKAIKRAISILKG